MRDDRRERGGYGGGGFQPWSFAPVKVGDELDVTIEAVGEKGDGVAKKDGFVLFVPGTKKGDTVRVKVTRVLRKVGFAEVVGEGSSSSQEGEESQQEQGYEEQSKEENYSSEDKESSEGQSDTSEDSENFGEEDQS